MIRRWTDAVVVLSGMSAAMHVGKMPVMLPQLAQQFELSLVKAGFLLSFMQMASMLLGLALALSATRLGLRKAMIVGSFTLGFASMAAVIVQDARSLLVLRAFEGIGLLLVTLPAPGLLRRIVDPDRLPSRMGVWGAYMPSGMAMALFLTPMVVGWIGWRGWWGLLGAVSAGMGLALLTLVPPDPPRVTRPTEPRADGDGDSGARRAQPWRRDLQLTLSQPGPWLVAVCFFIYALQWVTVLGFLPLIYSQAGVTAQQGGWMTACAAAVNIIGNLSAGYFLHRGVPSGRLLSIGFFGMVLGAIGVFSLASGVPVGVRFASVLVFSAVGGLVPATLFALAVRLAPSESTVVTTVGWMHQCSAVGQFCGPPLLAWLVAISGSWQVAWVAIGLTGLMAIVLVRGVLPGALQAATASGRY